MSRTRSAQALEAGAARRADRRHGPRSARCARRAASWSKSPASRRRTTARSSAPQGDMRRRSPTSRSSALTPTPSSSAADRSHEPLPQPVPPAFSTSRPMSAAAPKRPARERVFKLSSNESPLGPEPEGDRSLSRRPPSSCTSIPTARSTALARRRSARRYGLDPERIVCGTGSDELLHLLARAYAAPGDEVLYTEHGFLIYPIAALAAGATPVDRAGDELHRRRRRACSRPSRRAPSSSSSPTPTIRPAPTCRRRDAPPARRPAGDVLLVIDAAYAEYVTPQRLRDAASSWSTTRDNVVMTRTFSKIYGLGGLRLGWVYAPGAHRRRAEPRARAVQRHRSRRSTPASPRWRTRASSRSRRAHNAKWLRLAARAYRASSASTVHAERRQFLLIAFPARPAKHAPPRPMRF